MRLEPVRDPHRDTVVDGLAEVLVDCVDDGASVGFLAPLERDARAFWRGALARPGTATWVARDDDGRVAGVVQLHPAQLPNGAHRAEVAKLLVHPSARGRGLARRCWTSPSRRPRARGAGCCCSTRAPAARPRRSTGGAAGRRRPSSTTTPCYPDGRLAPCTFFVKRLSR